MSGNPAVRATLEGLPWTGGFASPPHGGFANGNRRYAGQRRCDGPGAATSRNC